MYAYVKGKLTHLYPTHVVAETAGAGYEIQTPNSYRLQKHLDHEVLAYTPLIVREGAQLLYGSSSGEEKDMFLSLTKATDIGPKSALAILATSTPNGVKRAIEDESDTYLAKFPGIGKKTARQIVLDSKGKVKIAEEDSDSLLQVDATSTEQDRFVQEVTLVLEALGYSKRELAKIEKTLNKNKYSSVGEAAKAGLQLVVS